MPSRSRLRTILHLALPIVGGMASQNVLNVVDTAMVGTLGDPALAGVGLASFANFMATALLSGGLSAGVQAIAARRKGEGREGETAHALNGGLLLGVLVAVPLSALLVWLAPTLFPYLAHDDAVVAQGVPYLRARLCAIAAVAMNFSFRGYWNGTSRPKRILGTLLAMHACNIFLNWVLIFGNLGAPALGTAGAGVATAVATCFGTAVYFALGWRHARANGFLARLPERAALANMVRVGLPAGVQHLFGAAGYTALFWIVGQIGTAQLAAANVLINVTLVAFLPGLGLGLCAAALVGQALGRRDPADARRWGREVAAVAAVAIGVLGLPLLLLPDPILGVFLHDPATIAIARAPLRLIGVTIGLEAAGMVLLHAQLGAGDSRRMMLTTLPMQWCVGLPLAWLLGPTLQMGLLGAWSAHVGYRAVQALVLMGLWRRGAWARVVV